MAKRQEQKEHALVRLLIYALGVQPAEFGLVPDEEGWVRVKDLLAALHDEEGWRHVRQTMLADASTRLDPDALEMEANRLRARERRYPPPDYTADPPAHLYLGLRRRAWPVVHQKGLEAREGGPLVLATDPDLALRLGRRRDQEPLLITVQAHLAKNEGAMFPAWGEEGLFLTEWVPAGCLLGPPLDEAETTKKPPSKKPAAPAAPAPPEHAGSFFITPEPTEKPYKQKGLKKNIAWKKERREKQRHGDG
ncbi:MAG: RNA 2'-phosphotransferase [Deltaproteobacteria bacterium]|nr:RNA 2'-phosphotransferase [Deltaproteobacteria bacterium]